MAEINQQIHPSEDKNLNSLRILSAIGIIVGCWSLLFEIYFFKGFILEIYFARFNIYNYCSGYIWYIVQTDFI